MQIEKSKLVRELYELTGIWLDHKKISKKELLEAIKTAKKELKIF